MHVLVHDRGGFMILWGCLVFLPIVYPFVSLFLVTHPYELSPVVATSILALGVFSVWETTTLTANDNTSGLTTARF